MYCSAAASFLTVCQRQQLDDLVRRQPGHVLDPVGVDVLQHLPKSRLLVLHHGYLMRGRVSNSEHIGLIASGLIQESRYSSVSGMKRAGTQTAVLHPINGVRLSIQCTTRLSRMQRARITCHATPALWYIHIHTVVSKYGTGQTEIGANLLTR